MSFWFSSVRPQLSKAIMHMLQLSLTALQADILSNSICGARTTLSFLQNVLEKSHYTACFKEFVLD